MEPAVVMESSAESTTGPTVKATNTPGRDRGRKSEGQQRYECHNEDFLHDRLPASART
jgi:hypothetical protein